MYLERKGGKLRDTGREYERERDRHTHTDRQRHMEEEKGGDWSTKNLRLKGEKKDRPIDVLKSLM